MLVVGGSGFIGRHLVRRCLEDTARVTIASRRHHTCAVGGAAVVSIELADRASLAPLAAGAFDYVFNLAGYIDHTPYFSGGRKVIEQHLIGVLNLIDALDRSSLKGFVQVGSSDEYGDLPAPQREDRVGRSISPYALAKQSAGAFVQMLAEREGFPGAVARLFLVYGPGQDEGRFLPQIITACLRNERFAVSPGAQQRDFCYVEDIVDGLVRTAVTSAAHGGVLNLGSGEGSTVRQVIERVVAMAGGGVPDFGARPYRAGESMALVPDIGRARTILGWQPETSLDQGLTRTIAYYRERTAS